MDRAELADLIREGIEDRMDVDTGPQQWAEGAADRVWFALGRAAGGRARIASYWLLGGGQARIWSDGTLKIEGEFPDELPAHEARGLANFILAHTDELPAPTYDEAGPRRYEHKEMLFSVGIHPDELRALLFGDWENEVEDDGGGPVAAATRWSPRVRVSKVRRRSNLRRVRRQMKGRAK